MISLLMLTTLALGQGDATPPSPEPQKQIKPMLRIEWTRGPNLPQGFQDSDGGFLGDTLVTVGGFCSGGTEEDNKRKPGLYPRGFLKKVWALEASKSNARWQTLLDFPGDARQGLFAAVVSDALYVWGGFSYSAPFTYQDGGRLRRVGGEWKWDAVPDLPYKLSSSAATVIGSRIYVLGGADYDGEKGFYTECDRAGEHRGLGRRLIVLDTSDLKAGWKRLPDCPGTHRFVHAAQAVDGRIYVIGGATGDLDCKGKSIGYNTIVDNWRFDPQTEKWSRLRDTPVSTGNFPKSSNLVYKNRYIILPGGHQYGKVANPDGTFREKYGVASQRRPASGLHNDVFVYDTGTDSFGTADKLPIDNNLPMAVVRDNKIFLLGGETGGGEVESEYYGHHPDLLLIGRISELDPKDSDPK